MPKRILWNVIFWMLFIGMYELVSYVREESLLSVMGNNVLKKASESEKRRLKKEKELKMLRGNSRKKSLIYRLDLLLISSGIKRRLPFMSTELFLLGLLCTIFTIVLLMLWISVPVIWILSVPVLIPGVIDIFLLFLSGKNYQRAEEQLLPFVNLISNYSHTEDDLVSIFGRMCPYLEEPYRSAVEEYYLYVKATGDTDSAFRELAIKIGHEQFERLIRNLEICCRHEANYKEIIDDSREQLMDYLRNKKEREAVRKNARIELLMLVGGCLLALWMMEGLTENSMLELLTLTVPGKIMLIYCGGVLAACVKLFFSAG